MRHDDPAKLASGAALQSNELAQAIKPTNERDEEFKEPVYINRQRMDMIIDNRQPQAFPRAANWVPNQDRDLLERQRAAVNGNLKFASAAAVGVGQDSN